MERENETRELAMSTDSDDELDFMKQRNIPKNSANFPEAFVHAIRHSTVRSLLTTSSSCCSSSTYTDSRSPFTDSDASSGPKESAKLRDQLTMIPESVLAALTNIQRNQLRRVREDASNHLERILRNVVRTVDVFYADQIAQKLLVPAKKMIGSEGNEETRVKEEIKKILKGEIEERETVVSQGSQQVAKKKRRKSVVESKDVATIEDENEEESDAVATIAEDMEEPVCQVMLNIVDDLNGISFDRQKLLDEVLEWMDRYPADSLPESFLETPAEEPGHYDLGEQETLFTDWEVKKNIRRLTLISEEMGLVKFEDVDGECKEDEANGDKEKEKRKLLEEKINKQKSRYIANKVFDVESLEEPKNWRTASNAIVQVLEEASASTTNQRAKQTFGNAHKQFRFMTELAEKRLQQKTKIELQLNAVTGKLNNEKKEVKSLRQKKQILETQVERCQDDIVELRKEVEVRDEMIKERSDQIYELECLNEEQEQALKTERESRRKAPPSVAQPAVKAQPRQEEQQQKQSDKSNQQPIKTASVTKEEPQSSEKQASSETQPSSEKQRSHEQAKQKTTRKTAKDGGLKTKKDNNEEEKRKKKEKEDTRRTSVTMSLKEAKAELEQLKRAGEARESVVKELKMKLQTETGRFEQEKLKLEEETQFHKLQTESMKKQFEMEQEAWERTKNEMQQEKDKLTNEVQAKEEIINFQEQRIQEVAREMTLSLMRAGLQANTATARGTATDKLLESKQMLAKLHLQYEYEMQKLKEYVKRESERHQAEARRLDTEYKASLRNIYRDTSVIFRAVNRFKECLAVLFDRENLADAAHDIRKLPNLLEDETTTDPRIKLLKMAGGITELMVQMEFKMSQALMNKRMEMKDNSVAKNFLEKDLEAREELLKKARELGNLQAEKLKKAREELSGQEVELLKSRHSETDKYVDLMERNKELSRQNSILNKELTFLAKELQDETKAKETQRQEMEKAASEMKKKLEEQAAIVASLKSENSRILSEQNLHIRRKDMIRNVKLLNDALAAKKIPEEKHMVAMAVLEQTIEEAGTRLACLARKYLLHKKWKKICAAMKEYRKGFKRPRKVEIYLKNMEQRIIEKKEKLFERKTEELQKKTEMYMCFKQMCNELNKEHGVHLIRPHIKRVYSSTSMSQLPEQQLLIHKKRQDHLTKMLKRNTGNVGNLSGIKGFKFFAPEEDTTSWEFPAIENTQSSIVTPKILDMDMKKARESYQRVLTSKSCGNFDNAGSKTAPWCRRLKIRESLLSLPPIASLYPEN